MLVYALESLSQKYIQYEPQWSDFNDESRVKLDLLLADINKETAAAIKATLLENAHLKLRAGFQQFICNHVEHPFFTSEAEKYPIPLQQCDLRRVARNIYDARSAYVHELTPLMHQLRRPEIARGEVFRWDREPHLTFRGVVRLAEHVIRTLIRRLPSVEREDFDWRAALPGVVRLPLAPEYWIHQAHGFRADMAPKLFGGFLQHFLNNAPARQPICDMSAVMEKIEKNANEGKEQHRRSMLALYWLYNACLYADLRRPNWEQFLESQRAIVEKPCIEMMAARVTFDESFPWTFAEGEAALTQYNETRFQKGILHLPQSIEVALNVAVANQALRENLLDKHRLLLRNALLNSAGLLPVQNAIQAAITNSSELELDVILQLSRPSIITEQTQRVAISAYFKFLKRMELGQQGDALSDWLEAESEMFESSSR